MTERMLPVGDAELWVAEQGEGPPLLLCNGGPGCCDYLEPVAAMIDDLAHVYRFEPRGCGRSSPVPPYDLETGLTDMERLREALEHESWIVGGHSAGASMALAYALAYPQRVRALLFLASPGAQDDREWHAIYRAGRDAGIELQPHYLYPYNPDVNREGNASWKEYIKQPAFWRRVAALPMPALAVSGSEDIRPSWPVEQIVNLMSRGRFELIEGAQHVIWLTHPDDLRAHLRAFLGELPFEEIGTR